jgi:membrane-associated phospholipid phosphatase
MNAVARMLSILGHPVLLLPLAAWLAFARGPEAAGVLAGFASFGVLVMGWSWWQVRHGRWTHVDASERSERRALNRFLLVALGAGSLLAWGFAPAAIALALGMSLLLVLAAVLSAKWWKLSLHVAFATYAALLLWRVGPEATALGLGFAAALAWSRWILERHTLRDLVAGALAGAAAGWLFWRVLAWQGDH